jgi:septal ring factor EnvC (AmiA/AmiB activator)
MGTRIQEWERRLEGGRIDFSALQADLKKLDAEVERDEAQLQESRTALEALKQDRDALAGLRNFLAHASRPLGGVTVVVGGDGNVPMHRTKREAILALLADRKEWSTTDIHSALVEQGVHPQSARASLLSTLSEMYSDEEVIRPRQGQYRLPLQNGANQK